MDLAHHGTTAQQSSAARLLTALTRSFLAQQAWASPFPDEFTLILRKKCVIAAAELHVVAIPQTELENYLQFYNLHKSRLFRYFSINSATQQRPNLKPHYLDE